MPHVNSGCEGIYDPNAGGNEVTHILGGDGGACHECRRSDKKIRAVVSEAGGQPPPDASFGVPEGQDALRKLQLREINPGLKRGREIRRRRALLADASLNLAQRDGTYVEAIFALAAEPRGDLRPALRPPQGGEDVRVEYEH